MLLPKILRGQSLSKGVAPLMIVKPLNVVKNIGAGICPDLVPPPMDSLSFEEAKETLFHGIVITTSHATHSADNSMGLEKGLKLL